MRWHQAESSARFSESGEPLLMREPHKDFLLKAFSGLPGGYVSLDASRTWLVYWTVHSLVLLDEPLPDDVQARVIGTNIAAKIAILLPIVSPCGCFQTF